MIKRNLQPAAGPKSLRTRLLASALVRMLGVLAAVSGASSHAAGTGWEALTPSVLKKPEPVDLARNPFLILVATHAPRSAAKPDAQPATKALISAARARVQGVVRGSDGTGVLVWGNRLYAPGQTVPWTDDAARAEVVIQLKGVGPRTVTFVARRAAEPDATPTELVVPLPGFFAEP